MRFSIIVPVYNIEKYLSRCLDSILKQDLRDFQLIVVDDGSTDGSAALCDRYAEKDGRITVIHKQNGGSTSARLAGCMQAEGEYILCVDGDDWIAADCLSSIEEIIAVHEPDIVSFCILRCGGGRMVPMRFSQKEGLYDRRRIRKEIFPSLIKSFSDKTFSNNICSKAIKRELFKNEQLLVDPRIKVGEDTACIVPCIYRAETVYLLDRCLYYYRYNESSVTKGRKPFDKYGPLLVEKHLRSRLDMGSYDFEAQMNRRTTHALFNVFRSYFRSDLPYAEAKKRIKRLLEIPAYSRVVREARFGGSVKSYIIGIVMKKKLLFPMYLLSKISF